MTSEKSPDSTLAGLLPVDAAPASDPAAVPNLLATLPQGGARLLSVTFDLLQGASAELRRASLYIGLIFVLTVGPAALLALGIAVNGGSILDSLPKNSFQSADLTPVQAAATRLAIEAFLAVLVAVAGYIVAAVEGQAIAIAVLAGRSAGQSISLREAIVRSRTVFWRLVRANFIVGTPIAIFEIAFPAAIAGGRNESQGGLLLGTAIGTLIGVPFAYIATGIVLGDVQTLEAIKRSLRLFRARKRTAILIAVFAAFAQYLLLFGVGVGLDIGSRAVAPLALGTDNAASIVLIGLLLTVFILALGTLELTVTAIAIAPQVVAFLALTRFTGGLDRARTDSEAQAKVGTRTTLRTGPAALTAWPAVATAEPAPTAAPNATAEPAPTAEPTPTAEPASTAAPAATAEPAPTDAGTAGPTATEQPAPGSEPPQPPADIPPARVTSQWVLEPVAVVRRFRLITLPLRVGVALGLFGMVAGLITIATH